MKSVTFRLSLPSVLFIVSCVLVASGIGYSIFGTITGSRYPELAQLSAQTTWKFQDYSTYFQKLSEEKGAPYAFEILLRASLPKNVDVHLLGHVVGDMLYKQQGIPGINVCTPDFRNACSHSVVIGILTDYGEGALPQIVDTCKKAPGGKGAYTMCFHGLGHGVLAYTGYNYEKAVAMCEKTGTAEYQYRESSECIGGLTMEMVAGVHDPLVWKTQVDNYLKTSDPLYPCTAPFMPKDAQAMCLVYLTPHLFTLAGLDLGNMTPELYPKAFSYCSGLDENEQGSRSACYGGFGKEFIGLAQGRDIRTVGDMQEPELHKIREWCALAGSVDGEYACNDSALVSLFWGGENNIQASLTFCAIAPEGLAQSECYQLLSDTIVFYFPHTYQRTALCRQLPESYKTTCQSGAV